ncbi:hypothetical protein SEPCBS119000_002813 [Sporothrix epigloea]|uniref:C6 zinc finger domain containing protein n=1 Tax=Sporothrix epigloea TaxID=1892477 RepID=A0ABP0DJI1_9PEZI
MEDESVSTPSLSLLGLAPPPSTVNLTRSNAASPSSLSPVPVSSPSSSSPSLSLSSSSLSLAAPASSSSDNANLLRGRSSARPTSTRRRNKLSLQERAKILEVRRQRACLRCKMLKIQACSPPRNQRPSEKHSTNRLAASQCSKENPCKPCLSSAVRGYERKVLSFCYCVRTRFTDVDIFHLGEGGPPPEIPDSVRALMDQIERPTLPPAADRTNDHDRTNSSFASASSTASSAASSTASSSTSTPAPPSLPSADSFEDTLLRWLTSPDNAPPDGTGSVVALLCEMVGNADSLRSAVDDRLPADFQTFLFTTSLAHTGWRLSSPFSSAISHRDLCIASHVCGSRIVRRLDRVLTPQFLAKCDRTTHRALLLLIFGLILGVSYSTRLTTSPTFPHDLLGAEMRHSPTLWLAMKEHLAQMLAHHLIFLGSTLGIKLDTAAERAIIDTAVNRWNKPERSLWVGIARSDVPEASSSGGGGTLQAPSSATSMAAMTSPGSYNHPQHLHQQHLSFTDPSSSQDSPINTAISMLSMVALSDTNLVELQAVPPMSEDDVSDNPESYYNMGTASRGQDGLSLVPTPTSMPAIRPAALSTPFEGLHGSSASTPRVRKMRSMWIVQPFDDGGKREPVSVFARFQLQQGQKLGLIV